MFDNISEFRSFYKTPLGRRVVAAMRDQIRAFWQGAPSMTRVFLGYGQPFTDRDLAALGLMPARRGAAVWPTSGRARSCLVNPISLPVPDVHLDRLLLVHALEFESNPGDLLDECWRVLDGAGRLMLIVPNRASMWARREGTPFGHGQPYSGLQLRRRLKQHGFMPCQTSHALFIPPIENRLILRFAPTIENLGKRWWPAVGGVVLVEAEKMLYAPSGHRQKRNPRLKPAPALVGQARDSLMPKEWN
ncbi:MAG: methyltransferase type 11 [Candidatus Puniceispirillum sp.]